MFAASIVFLREVPVIQAMIQIVTSLSLMMFIFIFKPFKDKNTVYFEVFNETCILMICNISLLYCGVLTDNNLKYNVAWVIVLIALLNIVINWSNLIITLLVSLYRKIRMWFIKRRLAKVQKIREKLKE